MSSTPTAEQEPSTADQAATERTEDINNAVIRLAGNSQDGIQTIGGLLAKLAGRRVSLSSTSAGGSICPVIWGQNIQINAAPAPTSTEIRDRLRDKTSRLFKMKLVNKQGKRHRFCNGFTKTRFCP